MPNSTLFLSYSHHDEVWKKRIASHLGVLGALEIWDDRKILPGESWLPAIEVALEEARIAILVVSADFLTSRFIQQEEVPRLLKLRQEKGLIVIPVIARPCAWKTIKWLAQIQCFPKDGRALSPLRKAQVENELATLALLVQDKLAARPQTEPSGSHSLQKPELKAAPRTITSNDFTERERQLLDLLVKNGIISNRRLGQALGISEDAVHRLMRSILDKLGLSNRSQVAKYVIRHGIFKEEEVSRVWKTFPRPPE